jgi:hypothetical protein
VSFTVTANDTEDGNLTGSSVRWYSSLDGLLGTGTSISASLSSGTHAIFANATDSDGLVGSASITVAATAPSSGSSGGGGGGGGGGSTNLLRKSLTVSAAGSSISLNARDVGELVYQGMVFSLDLLQAGQGVADLVVAGTPLHLSAGQAATLDLTADGQSDVLVKLVNVYFQKVDLFIKETGGLALPAPVAAPPAAPQDLALQPAPEGVIAAPAPAPPGPSEPGPAPAGVQEGPVPEAPARMPSLPWALLGASLLAFLSLPMVFYARYGVPNPLTAMRRQKAIIEHAQAWSRLGYSKRQIEAQLLKFFRQKEVQRGLVKAKL